MVILKSLKSIARFFITSSTTTTTTTTTLFPFSPLQNSLFRLPSQQGPLFLACHPWKLSQSATPLYHHPNAVVLRRVNAAINLNLLRPTTTHLPLNLDLQLHRLDSNSHHSLLRTFLNALISFSRLLSGPLLGWMITNDMYTSAMVGLAISGGTDWLDGYMARKMKIDSVVGSYLDPLADKVLIGCVALAMVHKDLLHLFQRASSLGWNWKSWFEFFNLDGTRRQKVEPLYISKVNTVVQLGLVAAAPLQPEFGNQETQSYITYMSWLVASTTTASTAAYGVQYMRRSAIVLKST